MPELETTKVQRDRFVAARVTDGCSASDRFGGKLCRDVEAALVALAGMMEIAELAMPDTFFQSDTRVQAARDILGEETT